jgi:hypothetical protein
VSPEESQRLARKRQWYDDRSGDKPTMPPWIGPLIGLIGLAFAVYQYRKRARLETVTKNALRRLAGEVNVVYSNAHWANAHLRNMAKLFTEANPDLPTIKKIAVDGARDATTCARQLALVHSQIKGIQESLFNDSAEILPDIPSDDVKEARRRIDEKKAADNSQAITRAAP